MDTREGARRGFGSRVGSVLLSVAALLGAICIVLVPLAVFFHITLIMFKTNSMSPTMPVGSLAVVHEIPASEIHVGDVVTVDRGKLPPVTHRVRSIAPAGGNARSITLRGDANKTDDPAPYVVTHVRRVIFSVPKLAYAVRTAQSPLVMLVATIAAAGVVTWAFWPRRHAARHAAVRT